MGLLINLNENQREAVEHDKGPLLIIAGAGTGKTAVLTQRIINIINTGRARPSEILALTFTEKATSEMQERVDTQMPLGYEEVFIATFHSFCDHILKQDGIHIGIDPGYKLMTGAESYILFKKNLFKFPLEELRPLGNPTKFINEMLSHFSRLQDEDVSPEEYLKYVERLEEKEDISAKELKELADTYLMWTELKIKESRLDFGDLIILTLKLFREKPHVLKKYQEMFKYVLVDEYQDTNYTQNVLVNTLMLGKDIKGASKKARSSANITVVGDDDQAIYKFRGAAISNILQFKEVYPTTKKVVLTQNYRSNQQILDAAYSLISYNNPNRLEIAEGINKRLVALSDGEPNSVQLMISKNLGDEADNVAKEILKLVGKDNDLTSESNLYDDKGQSSFLSPGGKELKFSDIALLVRANAHAEEFIQSFRLLGVPYKFSGQRGLYNRPEVAVLISFLRLLKDYKDGTSMFNLLRLDLWNLDDRDIINLFMEAKRRRISVFELIEELWGVEVGRDIEGEPLNLREKLLSQEGIEGITKFLEIFRESYQWLVAGRNTGQILYLFFKESGLLESYTKEDTSENQFKVQNISKFFDLIKKFERDNKGSTVYDYLDYLEYSIDVGETPSVDQDVFVDFDAVNIYTVHGSKGLEFPVVFMVNLAKGRFPSVDRSDRLPISLDLIKEKLPDEENNPGNLQEERRLFYVGATRAKDLLYLSVAQYYGEGKRKTSSSIFLDELLNRKVGDEVAKFSESKSNNVLDWGNKYSATPADTIDYTLFKKHLGKRLSYSEISEYEKCPKKYMYKYVYNIPTFQSSAASFGSTIHLVLKDFYKLHKSSTEGLEGIVALPTLEDLYYLYDKHWNPYGYDSKEHEKNRKEKGMKLLKRFYEEIYTKNEKILDLERKFNFAIEDIVINGMIDRIDVLDSKDESVELIDYKTGNTRDQKDVDNDLQLAIYAVFAKESLKFKKVTASLLFIEHGIKLETEIPDEKLKIVKEKILSIAKLIQKSHFTATPNYMTCKFCDYNSICEDALV